MKDFRKLKIWEQAHSLTLDVYRLTKSFPKDELYGLSSQMRRCSASIGANIAEGCGKRGNGEFQRFLQIASGSASELDYHCLLATGFRLFTGSRVSPGCGSALEIKAHAHISTDKSRSSAPDDQMLTAKCQLRIAEC